MHSSFLFIRSPYVFWQTPKHYSGFKCSALECEGRHRWSEWWNLFVPVVLFEISDFVTCEGIPTLAGRLIKENQLQIMHLFFFALRDKKLFNPEHIFFNQSAGCLCFHVCSSWAPFCTMWHFSALGIPKTFLALMKERGIVRPLHKVEFYGGKSRGQLVPLPSFYILTNGGLDKAGILT